VGSGKIGKGPVASKGVDEGVNRYGRKDVGNGGGNSRRVGERPFRMEGRKEGRGTRGRRGAGWVEKRRVGGVGGASPQRDQL